jgi:hypothetical protein
MPGRPSRHLPPAATLVSGAYRNTSAEIVVIASTKKSRATSTSASVQIGSVTRRKIR